MKSSLYSNSASLALGAIRLFDIHPFGQCKCLSNFILLRWLCFLLTGKMKQKEKKILMTLWTLGKEKVMQDSKTTMMLRLHFRVILLYVIASSIVHKTWDYIHGIRYQNYGLFRKSCPKSIWLDWASSLALLSVFSSALGLDISVCLLLEMFILE